MNLKRTKKLKNVGRISKMDKELFDEIRDSDNKNIFLQSITFNGKKTSCICLKEDAKDKLDQLVRIYPLAIMINSKILDNNQCLCPDGVTPKKHKKDDWRFEIANL